MNVKKETTKSVLFLLGSTRCVELGPAAQIQQGGHLVLCESVSVQSSKVIVVVDFSSGCATWDVACALREDLRRLSAAQCSSVLCAVLLPHCLFLQTHTHAHTLKSSLHTAGKTGVTDWMLPAEYFSAVLLWHTQAHTYTPHVHCVNVFFYAGTKCRALAAIVCISLWNMLINPKFFLIHYIIWKYLRPFW